jgi:hypothetical protein
VFIKEVAPAKTVVAMKSNLSLVPEHTRVFDTLTGAYLRVFLLSLEKGLSPLTIGETEMIVE